MMNTDVRELVLAAIKEQPATVEKVAALVEAALAYGELRAHYHAAWITWTEAAPDEYKAMFASADGRAVDSPAPSRLFDRDVAQIMRATNESARSLEDAARALYAARAAATPAPPTSSPETAPCVDCGAPNAPLDRGEHLCIGCSTERDRICAEPAAAFFEGSEPR